MSPICDIHSGKLMDYTHKLIEKKELKNQGTKNEKAK